MLQTLDKLPKPFIIHHPFHPIRIDVIEQKYGGAIYMGPWTTKRPNGGWNDLPVEVFYQPNPDTEKGHSHYFGIFVRENQVFITNAESAFSEPIAGVLASSGEVVVSRYAHDFVQREGFFIDGGRDYCRLGGTAALNREFKMVSVTVDGPNFLMKRTFLDEDPIIINSIVPGKKAA